MGAPVYILLSSPKRSRQLPLSKSTRVLNGVLILQRPYGSDQTIIPPVSEAQKLSVASLTFAKPRGLLGEPGKAVTCSFCSQTVCQSGRAIHMVKASRIKLRCFFPLWAHHTHNFAPSKFAVSAVRRCCIVQLPNVALLWIYCNAFFP